MKIEFTKEEAVALFQLVDIAIRANGLSVAEGAVHLAKKIDNAVKEADQAEKEVQE